MKFKDLNMNQTVSNSKLSITKVPGGVVYFFNRGGSHVFVPACQDFELEIPGTEDKENDH